MEIEKLLELTLRARCAGKVVRDCCLLTLHECFAREGVGGRDVGWVR